MTRVFFSSWWSSNWAKRWNCLPFLSYQSCHCLINSPPDLSEYTNHSHLSPQLRLHSVIFLNCPDLPEIGSILLDALSAALASTGWLCRQTNRFSRLRERSVHAGIIHRNKLAIGNKRDSIEPAVIDWRSLVADISDKVLCEQNCWFYEAGKTIESSQTSQKLKPSPSKRLKGAWVTYRTGISRDSKWIVHKRSPPSRNKWIEIEPLLISWTTSSKCAQHAIARHQSHLNDSF